jgi:hypothetical protein
MRFSLAMNASAATNVDGVGAIDATDLLRARELVVGRTPSGPVDVDFCDVDVDGDAICGASDLYLIERAANGKSATIQDACDAFKGPYVPYGLRRMGV